jgi:hypothetical protein
MDHFHHAALVSHGYKYKGEKHGVHVYQHRNGARASHFEGHKRTVYTSANGKKSTHSTESDSLQSKLHREHGKKK